MTEIKYLQVRVTPELHTAIRMQALKEGTTVKELLTNIVTDYLTREGEQGLTQKSGPEQE